MIAPKWIALKIFQHEDRPHVSRRGKVSNGNGEDRNHNFITIQQVWSQREQAA
jgi:hypothetical protein